MDRGIEAGPAQRIPVPPVVWTSLLFDRSGYADEARNFVLALDQAGVRVKANPANFGLEPTRLVPSKDALLRGLAARSWPDRFVHVTHFTAETFRRHRKAILNVGRTMAETDRLPPYVVAKCNEMDEVWVPSRFHVETFGGSGVDPGKLHVVPQGIDVTLYDPAVTPPLELPGVEGFVFLSVMEWGRRKGWDVLVRAYLEEFRRRDDVTLVMKLGPSPWGTFDAIRRELDGFIRGTDGRRRGTPRIVVLDRSLSDREMPSLYRAAHAYVMPSRGEGWGRPYMEAMAMALPTIGTRWSGNLEFMDERNSYLLDHELVDIPETSWREAALCGLRWAEPSVEHLRRTMRHVAEHPEEAAARGVVARRDVVERFNWSRVASVVVERLRAAGVGEEEGAARGGERGPGRPVPVVAWEGHQFTEHSLAIVNREICRHLVDSPRVELRLVADHPATAAGVVDPRLLDVAVGPPESTRPVGVHVRHFWPPSFEPPPEGHLVLMQPWEYGSLPRDWIEPMNELADEVWVPSAYVRECFVRSGVDPDRVVVVPNGVHPGCFHAAVPPFELPTRKRFRFLYVGGTIPRKGADILLDVYLRTFQPEDDVCLVIKDFGTDSFYRGQGLKYLIQEARSDPRNPEILYSDDELPMTAMARLYTACQCLVHPYRGEGFGLPIAEAMACGLPVVVPDRGACLDYCDPSTAYLVPAREVRMTERQVGGVPTVELPWVVEVDREELAAAMRRVVDRPDEARAVGRRAAVKVHGGFTWARTARTVIDRVEALVDRPIRRFETRAAARGRWRYPQVVPAPSGEGAIARRDPTNAARKTLSVCLVVRNEEERLARCLESARGLWDELVVVDTGSTDRTVEIAESFGARVFHAPWVDDFSAVRNEYLRHASKDWILALDADNLLDPAQHEEIRRLIQTDEPVGFAPRQVSEVGPQGQAAVIEHRDVRIFPNRPDLRYVGRIHAQVLPRRPDLDFRVAPCDLVVYHQGYRRSEEEARQAHERYAGIIEAEVREQPDEPYHAYNLGILYQLLGRSAEAERLLLRAIRGCRQLAAQGRAPLFFVHAHVVLATALLSQGRNHEAEQCARQVLALAPDLADAWAGLAVALVGQGRLDEALEAYRLAHQHADRAVLWPTDRAVAWKALLGMGGVFLLMHRWSEALACLERADAASPDNPAILGAMAQALESLGRGEDADRAARRAAELTA